MRAARATRSFLPLLTNNITAFWRCRCRSRCRFLNSLLRTRKIQNTKPRRGLERFDLYSMHYGAQNVLHDKIPANPPMKWDDVLKSLEDKPKESLRLSETDEKIAYYKYQRSPWFLNLGDVTEWVEAAETNRLRGEKN